MGGSMYQKLGLVKPYQTADLGRAKATGNAADTGSFKVPSLRNVEKTHPYFHDGSVTSLSQAVSTMAEYHGQDVQRRGRHADRRFPAVAHQIGRAHV